MNLNFNPFPSLHTERLILRGITEEDAEALFALRSNKQVMDALDKVPFTELEQAKAFIKIIDNRLIDQAGINWAVCLKENNKLIGDFGFHRIDTYNHRAEIGYALLPQFHNMGIATEAISQIIELGFNSFGFHSMEVNINPNNASSEKLLLKLGFVKEAHFKENYYFNGLFLDSVIYSLLKSNYQKR